MSEKQRETLLKSYCEAGMDSRDDRSIHSKPTSSISIQPADSGINNIPFPVLQNMFTKTESLLTDKVAIPIPTSAGKEHIVCIGKKTLKVISEKGGAISCDRQCGNKTTKLCAHTIAVAEFTNTLPQLISWFIRLKSKGATISAMALSGA